ncbi:MAG: hypothetical protein Q8M16_22430 [Pirellulaceae bacterium]|nr:hypothetical protein [Pirellulaceae bacterium]
MSLLEGDASEGLGDPAIASGVAVVRRAPFRLPGEICWADYVNATEQVGISSSANEVKLERHFNRPTGLVPDQMMVLGCWSNHAVVSAWLNDQILLPTHINFAAPASSCFSLSIASFKAYNSVGLVFRSANLERLRIDQVALGLSDLRGDTT